MGGLRQEPEPEIVIPKPIDIDTTIKKTQNKDTFLMVNPPRNETFFNINGKASFPGRPVIKITQKS